MPQANVDGVPPHPRMHLPRVALRAQLQCTSQASREHCSLLVGWLLIDQTSVSDGVIKAKVWLPPL